MDDDITLQNARDRVMTDPEWLPYAAAEVAAECLGLADGERWALDAHEALPMLRVMRENMPTSKLHPGFGTICRIKAASLLESLIRAGTELERRVSMEVERRIERDRESGPRTHRLSGS